MTIVSELSNPFWTPQRHRDRRPLLVARNRIKAAFRQWFLDQDFVEIEAGQLQVSPGNETHLHGLKVELLHPNGQKRHLFLHTSPEFACKKLLAAGETALFDFARVFRDRERGPLHAPEFTMLEWYRVQVPLQQLMADCAALLALAARTCQASTLRYRDQEADPFLPPERLSVQEAFERFAGLDLLATTPDGDPDRDALARQMKKAGIRCADDDSWSDLFSRIMVEKIEPCLGIGRATILHSYPVHEAALARPDPHDPLVAERFELYACGVELANGFGELTDPVEQRARFEQDMQLKQRIYGEAYPIDEDFLQALAVMPPASGIALGFDRLVMLTLGAPRIDDVLWTPLSR
jgi:elongation factor P--(R)-beta-lysine ligase